MFNFFKYFLYLGTTGFGGPLMLIQHMRVQYVNNEKKMTNEEFDQVFTLIKVMPGPIAFQMAVYLGQKFYKLKGAALAALGLILPSFIMMVVIGYGYQTLASVTFVQPLLKGFLYSASAVILFSLKSLLISNYKFKIFIPIVVISLVLSWQKSVPEPLLILCFGIFSVLLNQKINKLYVYSAAFLLVDWLQVYEIFKISLFSGAVVFGTGFALIPVLKTNFVDIHHWLTLKEFTDGVVFGQMTPGPVTITGAFLGYQISGLIGALAVTLGIFFMPFFHMVTWFPKAVNWLIKQKWIHDFLVGASAAVVGCILMIIVSLNLESYKEYLFWFLFLFTLIVLIKKPKFSIFILIIGSGLTHVLYSLFFPL